MPNPFIKKHEETLFLEEKPGGYTFKLRLEPEPSIYDNRSANSVQLCIATTLHAHPFAAVYLSFEQMNHIANWVKSWDKRIQTAANKAKKKAEKEEAAGKSATQPYSAD